MVSKLKYLAALLLLMPALASAQLTVQQGGIGTSTVPRNYVVIGSSALHLTAAATSTLGLESPLTFSSPLSRTGNAVSFLFNTTNTWTGLNTFQLGFISQASSTAIHLHLTGLGTAAGAFLAVDPSGEVIATTSPSSGGTGTVTNIATTFPIQGGPITTTGTLTFGGLSTTTTWTQGGVAVAGAGKNTLYTAATGTVSGSGVISVTAGQSIIGSGLTIACSTCGTGSVTSITAGNGLNGGTITTAGTIDLKSYFATSSLEVKNQVAFFSSSSGFPSLLGGSTTLTFNPVTANLTTTNASTTNLTASQSLFVNGSPVTGFIYATYDYATSTAWTATSSRFMEQTWVSTAYYGIKCAVTPAGATVNVQIGNGVATTTMVVASSTNNSFNFASPVTFAANSVVTIYWGTPVSSPVEANCSTKRTQGFQ